jgi:Tfp pilus assembly protein PilN
MSVAINLLPDIRQAKLRDQRRRRLALSIGTLVCVACVGGLALLFLTTQAQKLRIGQLTRQIQTGQATISQTENLSEMLTLQRNLASLPKLYTQRVLMTRLFTVLSGISPKELGLTSLDMETVNTLRLGGTARSYATVTKLVRALEASNVTLGEGSSQNNQPHFSDIVITSVAAENDGKVTFTMNLTFSGGLTSGN